jgi:hypothetical protein
LQEAADDGRIYHRLTSGHSGQAVHEVESTRMPICG